MAGLSEFRPETEVEVSCSEVEAEGSSIVEKERYQFDWGRGGRECFYGG